MTENLQVQLITLCHIQNNKMTFKQTDLESCSSVSDFTYIRDYIKTYLF